MKTMIITLVSLCFTVLVQANNQKPLDTIYANEKMNIALFFPSDIRQAITGSENILFSYNREDGQNLGLLKATPESMSNLLVITTAGKVYSYIIKYAEKLKKLNYFVSVSESIGNENREPKKTLEKVEQGTTPIENTYKKVIANKKEVDFLQKSSIALLKLPERKNKIRRKKGVSLAIKNKVHHSDYVYIQFEIKNHSGIDFDIDFLELYKVHGNKKRKASYQELNLKPILRYNLPTKIRHGEIARIVHVFHKFTLDKNEKVLVKLKERFASRVLELKFK